MSSPAPPFPGTKTSFGGVVGRFLLGAVIGPAMCLAVASCAFCGMANELAEAGGANLAGHAVEVFIGFILLALACVLLAMFTHWAFKKISGSAPAYVSGVAASFTFWSLSAGLKGEIALVVMLVIVGPVLTFVAWTSARTGIRAHARRFRIGCGNRCAHCTYDLSATAEHQVCPECGGTLRYDEKK